VAEVCSQGRRKVPWQQMMLPCFIDGQAWTKLLLLHLLDTPLALLGEPFVISDVESIGDVEICLDSGREATTED